MAPLTAPLYALDTRSGKLLWSSKTGNQIESSPAVVNGVVYVGSDALDAQSGKLLWSSKTGGSYFSPVVNNGVVYVGSGDSLYALDARAGKSLWSYKTGYSIDYSSPAVVNGMVYVGSYDGRLYAFHLPGSTM